LQAYERGRGILLSQPDQADQVFKLPEVCPGVLKVAEVALFGKGFAAAQVLPDGINGLI